MKIKKFIFERITFENQNKLKYTSSESSGGMQHKLWGLSNISFSVNVMNFNRGL